MRAASCSGMIVDIFRSKALRQKSLGSDRWTWWLRCRKQPHSGHALSRLCCFFVLQPIVHQNRRVALFQMVPNGSSSSPGVRSSDEIFFAVSGMLTFSLESLKISLALSFEGLGETKPNSEVGLRDCQEVFCFNRVSELFRRFF